MYVINANKGVCVKKNTGKDEIFRPSRPTLGPTQLPVLYNEYRFFPGGKVRPGRAANHSPPSSAAVMEE